MPVSVPSRARVFISYKRHVQPDESLALALSQVLSVPHDVFLDQKTPVGTRWGQRIDTALEQTDVLLVLLSAEAVCSEMVLEEVKKVHYRAKAQAGQPTILPVRLAYDDALPYPLSAYLDCITTAFWSGPDDTPRLIAELLQAIAGTPLHPGPLSPPVRPAAEEPGLQPPLTGNEPASPVFGAFSLAAAQPPNVLATTLRRLRQRLARSWRRLGSGLAVLVFGAYGVQALDLAEMPIPGGTGRAWSLGLALLLFGLTRFPHLARRITRLILGPVPPPSGLPRLFRGPRPYDADEVLPGRQQECDDCWQMLRLAPFFILEGESGCGKSSLLNAALLPRAQRVMRVIACRLADDPFGRLCAALRQEAYRTASTPPSAATLTAVIAQSASAAAPQPLLLCIDQGEELFVTVRDAVREQCLRVLQEAIAAGQLRLLIAMRSDFRDLLDRLCRTLDPEQQIFNLGSYYTLKALRTAPARAVLDELLRPAALQDARLRQQLDDFAGALVQDLLRPPRDQRLCQEDENTVLPVELQTVGMLLESVGFQQVSVAGLRRQGGKAGLMRTSIDDAKTYAWHKTGVLADQTLLILRQLISPAGTKWAQSAAAIGWSLGLPGPQVAQVLDAFDEKYLVHRLPAETTDQGADAPVAVQRYELRHEYLVHILAEAPDPMLQRAQDAAERVRFWQQRTRAGLAPEVPRAPRRRLARLRALFAKPMPLLESLRLWSYARRGEERRMLWRNVRGWSAQMLLILLVLSPFWWYLILDVTRRVHNMGELVVRHAPGASLTLRCIRHYGEKTACAFDTRPV